MALRETLESTTRPIRRRSRERTENEIYEVAARLFAEKGYPGTSVEDIAREVGIHKSTVFHYVENKQELLAVVLDRGLSRYVSSLKAIATRADHDPVQRLAAAVRNHLDFVFEHRTELTVFLRERRHLSGARGEAYLRMSDNYQAIFTRIIRDGMRTAHLAPGDPHLMTLFLLGSANWIVEWYRPDGRLSREAITEQFVDSAVIRMLAARPEEAT